MNNFTNDSNNKKEVVDISTISEEQAVAISMDIAVKDVFLAPKAVWKTLKDGIWDIDIQSDSHTDIYIHVKIDAKTGAVLNIERDSRA